MNLDEQNEELNSILTNRLGQLQAVIEAKEKELKSMMVPRDVVYVYDHKPHRDADGQAYGETLSMIGLIKWQGSWRLCHGTVYDPGPDEAEWKPLVDSSVSDRLKSALHLEQLKTKVIESKKTLVPEIEAVIEMLATSLDKVGTTALATPKRNKPKQKPMSRNNMNPTDKQIKEADSVTAIMNDDSDRLSVFLNPNMPLEMRDGQPHYRPVFLDVNCNSADDLFELRTRVRALRGDDGMNSKESRAQELLDLIEVDLPKFVKIFEKRTNLKFRADQLPSKFEAYRMVGDILQYEHAGE